METHKTFSEGIPLNFVLTVTKRLNSQIRSAIKFVMTRFCCFIFGLKFGFALIVYKYRKSHPRGEAYLTINENEERKRCGPSHAKWFGEDMWVEYFITPINKN